MSAALHGAVQTLAAADVGGFDLSPGRLLVGAFTGLTYGLLAVGLVLVYRASKFINFAHGAIGVFGAAVVGATVTQLGLPYWVAFPLGLAAAAGVSALTEAGIIRRLKGAPTVLGMVATLGLGTFLLVFALVLNSKASSGNLFPEPPGLPTFEISGAVVGPPYVAMIIFTPLLLLALTLFLKRSRYGLAIRAAADNPDAASLAGVSAKRMVTLSWALAGAIAAFSATLVYPTRGVQDFDSLGPSLLLLGLAGAVIGRLTSLPIAFFSSMVIGIVENVVRSRSASDGTAELVVGVIIIVALLRQKELSRRQQPGGEWGKVKGAAMPSAYERVWLIRNLGRFAMLAIVGYLAYLAFAVSNGVASVLTTLVGTTLVGLSVFVVTGLAGQLSLGQFAFAGIGAAVSVQVVNATGHFDLGLWAAALVGAVAAALVGVPALRLRGLALAVSTLAFALITGSWLLRQEFMLGTGVSPAKPIIGSFVFSTAKGYYLFSVGVLALGFWLTANLRRGAFGRLATALRDNEDAARAFAVPSRLRKLQVYAAAGALAGLGGAVIGHGQSTLTSNQFLAQASIDVVAQSVVGGLSMVVGPFLGAIYLQTVPDLLKLNSLGDPTIILAVATIGWLVLIVVQPAGFAGIVAWFRNRIADVIARLRGINPAEARRADEAGVAEDAMSGIDLTSLRGASHHGTEPLPLGAADVREALEPGPLPPLAEVRSGQVLLSARGIAKSFGGVKAVRGVDLDVYSGEILGIIGPNGAGKTTFFEIVAGFTPADEGSVSFLGRDITSLTPEKRANLGLVRSFQSSALFPTMTVRETVMVACEREDPSHIGASIIGWPRAERAKRARADDLLDVMGLGAIARRAVGELSTGTRRMVELTCMLALEPRLLLLDEPAGGLAQSEGDKLVELVTAIRRDLNATVVVVEHDLPLLFRMAERMVAMELGQVIAVGTPQEVRNHPEVVRSYLGGEVAAVERSGAFPVAAGAAVLG